MHLDVKNCAQPHIPLLLCEISGYHLGTNLLTPISSVGIKRTFSRIMFTSSAINLTVNLRSDRRRSLTRAAFSPLRAVAGGHPLRCSSSTRLLPSENILCQRKRVLLILHHLQRPAVVFHVLWWHCHRA